MHSIHAVEKEGLTVSEALDSALDELGREIHEVDYDVLDEGTLDEEGDEGRPVLIRAWLKQPDEVQQARQMVEQILKSLEIDASLETEFDRENNSIYVNINSDDDAGILIGRQGQTLESLQYLIQVIMDLKDFHLVLDVSDYRERHRLHLIEVAEKVADRVLRSRKRVTLRPMSARDRKIIHEAIKHFSELASSSIGVDPNRKVVVSLKRGESTERHRRPSSRYPSSSSSRRRGPGGGEGGGSGNRPYYSPRYR